MPIRKIHALPCGEFKILKTTQQYIHAKAIGLKSIYKIRFVANDVLKDVKEGDSLFLFTNTLSSVKTYKFDLSLEATRIAKSPEDIAEIKKTIISLNTDHVFNEVMRDLKKGLFNSEKIRTGLGYFESERIFDDKYKELRTKRIANMIKYCNKPDVIKSSDYPNLCRQLIELYSKDISINPTIAQNGFYAGEINRIKNRLVSNKKDLL